MEMHSPDIAATLEPAAELDRLGDEIAELAAHLEAATARLLDLIRHEEARRRNIPTAEYQSVLHDPSGIDDSPAADPHPYGGS